MSLQRRAEAEGKCLLSAVNGGLAKEEGLVFCGSLGRKYIMGGGGRPTSAQGKTVISNNQALPFPRGMGCLGGRQSQLQRCHHAMDSIPVSKAE